VWRLQGWLPTPEPSATSAELESWLTGRDPVHAPVVVTYAFAHVNSQPETVYHLPRPWWLLGCSGLFLVVALGSFFAPVPRVLFWALLVVMALTVLGIGTFWPAALAPVVFGLQPGVALFVVFAVGHWLVQAQYRRQLVFMSGFSRAKPGSTMVRADSAKRPRDASTVDDPDAPVDTGSSKPGGTPAGS